ncbi:MULTISPECIES: aldose epimerase family protein [unclassified Mesorhizobium]|uniref:aldose epimerase family protein n=1 Tax=unclassified Mesorhizobium TaxID=325217 RepID=UPI000FD9A3B2|nr:MULTISPECIES: aldose epimerase family protein [unclassified Mesorhizobium]TGT71946.1 galactose mutarotase [Mesorhizobium sp. M2E.F.Ca.ET.166.01.1.1]TGV99339.1 galactose mutarotase [Mesorhizobium sp. M2E.F.Ca.ET.154.01.1.1]
MPITQQKFGELDGRFIKAYCISNANGLSAELITFGARLVGLKAPDRQGNFEDIVLGLDDVADYATTDHYFGASCGRYGNRIKNSEIKLNGKTYALSANEGGNHLHGGQKGLDKHIWAAFPDEVTNAVTFTHLSPDGDQGYPGEVLVKARYELTDDNRLIITMTGTTDKPTVLNLVNHAYWNAAGHASGGLHDQLLTVEADFYTPVAEELLTTGEILTVEGTPFDFRVAKPIGQDLDAVPNAGVAGLSGGGFDHNWVLRDLEGELRPVATLYDPKSGRGLSLRSTQPGVQIYTGGYITPMIMGKGNHPYCPYAGLTFETQKFPCAPSIPHFPSTRLDPGQVYEHVMEYKFFAR